MIETLGIDESLPTEVIDYRIGMYCGVLDGALDVVMILVDGGKFFIKNSDDTIFESEFFRKSSIRGKIVLAAGSIGLFYVNPVLGTVNILIGDEIIEFSQDLYSYISQNGFGELLNGIQVALEEYFGDLTFQHGTVCAGHAAGILVFEIAGFVLSAGQATSLKAALKAVAKSVESASASVMTLGKTVSHTLSELGDIGGLICKIAKIGCFVENTPVLMARASQTSTTNMTRSLAIAAAAIPVITPTPIQDVQLLDYVVAHKTVNAGYLTVASAHEEDTYLGLLSNDPYTSAQQRERDRYALDDQNWHEVIFEQVHGSSVAKLALHDDWIAQKGYHVNAVVQMDLPEQGISGPFMITSIKHILPQKKPVDEDPDDDWEYRPVTGLFSHISDQVHDITFDNGEIIGVTYQHPVYSVTADDWRLAGELEVGEKVLTYMGRAIAVNTEKIEGVETVYNIEVKELHNFLVGGPGIVVHNNYLQNLLKGAKGAKNLIGEAYETWLLSWFQNAKKVSPKELGPWQQREYDIYFELNNSSFATYFSSVTN